MLQNILIKGVICVENGTELLLQMDFTQTGINEIKTRIVFLDIIKYIFYCFTVYT